MAKGVEDTAFYRYHRLVALNEVGGAPDRFGVGVDEFHRWASGLAERWPATMTTLSTHDTKRSEDVRARLAVLSEVPAEWAGVRHAVRSTARVDRRDAVPAPPDAGRRVAAAGRPGVAFAEKAMREAKVHTSWTGLDEAHEAAVRAWLAARYDDAGLRRRGARTSSRRSRPPGGSTGWRRSSCS